MSIDWKRFRQLVAKSQTIVITSHIRPDCDALGSELGMAEILERLGKQVRIVNGQETPPNLEFIDPQQRIQTLGSDVAVDDLIDADLILILDTSAWAQLGPMNQVIKQRRGKLAVLDHHPGEDDLGAEWFKNVTAEATGRLVVEAADALGVPLNATMAEPLFAALATDTGWFRYNSVTSYTYEVAARLVDAGAIPAEIFRKLYERETPGRIRLRGCVLQRIHLELDGTLAHSYILKEDYPRTGALPSDTEDLVNESLTIEGTEFAVIFIEQPAGGFKISFRSRTGQAACNTIAAEFGGGGHRAAAGAFVKGPFEQVQAQVLQVVRQALQQAIPTRSAASSQ